MVTKQINSGKIAIFVNHRALAFDVTFLTLKSLALLARNRMMMASLKLANGGLPFIALFVSASFLILIPGAYLQAHEHVVVDADGAETDGASPCLTAQRQRMVGRLMTLDAFMPVCNEAGNFEPRQCFMFSRECFCVDTVTGAEITGTRRRFGDGILNCDRRANRRRRGLIIERKFIMTMPDILPAGTTTASTDSADHR